MTKYMQYSKKLTTAALVLYFITTIICIAQVAFLNMSASKQETIASFHGAAATQCGVAITGYMGNSGIEKYSNSRYQYQKLTTMESAPEVENG